MQQMGWREALDEAGNAAEVEALSSEVTAQRRARLSRVGELLDGPQASAEAAALAAKEVRALMFIDRLLEEVDNRLQRYEDEEGA
jgi:molecular chaperone HscB